jgi:hypothetical protein
LAANVASFLPWQPTREEAWSHSALKHRELNHTVFDLAKSQSLASDTLERVSMLVEIAERLSLCSKGRLETTHLPNRADREHKADRLSLICLSLRHDPDTFGH